jgi:hypothetical protein
MLFMVINLVHRIVSIGAEQMLRVPRVLICAFKCRKLLDFLRKHDVCVQLTSYYCFNSTDFDVL